MGIRQFKPVTKSSRFRSVPEDETRLILGATAAEVYGVDVAALQDVVDRIGPRPADVHGPAAG